MSKPETPAPSAGAGEPPALDRVTLLRERLRFFDEFDRKRPDDPAFTSLRAELRAELQQLTRGA